MRSIRLTALLLATLIGLPAVSHAATWQLQPEASHLDLAFKQGSSEVKAAFKQFSGSIVFDPAHLDQTAITMTVDLTSFASGDAGRDGQATGAPWLAADTTPKATYKVLSITQDSGDVYDVEAELTLKGVTQHLAHKVTIKIDGDTAHATGTVDLPRLDYGVGKEADPSGNTVSLDVGVSFDIEAKQG